MVKNVISDKEKWERCREESEIFTPKITLVKQFVWSEEADDWVEKETTKQ